MKTSCKMPRAVVAVVAGTLMACCVAGAGAQQPYVGEVMTFAGTFCTQGYLSLEGQTLPISDDNNLFQLFQLFGTTYGGDGQITFALPNLVGATVLGTGQGVGLPAIALGQTGGNTSTVTAQNAIAKSVQVPATQSPFVSLAKCVSLFGVYPTSD